MVKKRISAVFTCTLLFVGAVSFTVPNNTWAARLSLSGLKTKIDGNSQRITGLETAPSPLQGPKGVIGPAGPAGADGRNGADGADGSDGTPCWDMNGNGVADLEEDFNGDSFVDVLDCQGDSLWLPSGSDISFSDGNVGIGTTTPRSKLDIVDDSDSVAPFENNADLIIGDHIVRVKLGFKFGSATLETHAGLMDIRNSYGNWAGGDNGAIRFFTNTRNASDINSGEDVESLRISNTGNVGIGTTSPLGKLDVNGAIYQRGGVLHADYVFGKEYKLESIREHADFMWENKHLKAIPKATVDEKGMEIVEVGSHRKGILEELEKAHIYISQLDKQNAKLANGINALRQERQNQQEQNKKLEKRLMRLEELIN